MRAEIKSLSERINDQGENVSERQDQSGILYEDAKRFLAETSNFIEQRHGGVGLGMKPYEREEEAMVQPNTRRRKK